MEFRHELTFLAKGQMTFPPFLKYFNSLTPSLDFMSIGFDVIINAVSRDEGSWKNVSSFKNILNYQ